MKRLLLLIGMLGVIAAAPALAGDAAPVPPPWPPWFRGFPLDPGWRAQSNAVRMSDACWHTCETACSRQFQACATAYTPNNCRSQSDACDLSCVKSCRTYGGPLVDFTFTGP